MNNLKEAAIFEKNKNKTHSNVQKQFKQNTSGHTDEYFFLSRAWYTFSFNGVFHPKLAIHTLATHPNADGGSGEIF